ncbi:MAG: hypothetical protein IJX63_10245 [Lachnospiraceae bacterium]|nr:hypothetical protein [Lachnospiraceae bacterium]
MKLGKYISLFFLCSVVSLGIGMFIGYRMNESTSVREAKAQKELENISSLEPEKTEQLVIRDEPVIEVTAQEDKVNADTVYIVEERDMDTGNVIQTSIRIPQKYIGMTREQLIENLSDYAANPPLSELERGFVSAELLSFSANQVEVQMNYQYVEPTGSFYIVAYDNYVVVMLEDKKTVFLDTVIKVTELPISIQQDVLQGLFIPNEESLYDFLENYTS